MSFLKHFQKSSRTTRYRICRNKYNYYKVKKEYWWSFPFVFWPIWTCGSYWNDICELKNEKYKVIMFNSKKKALEFIKAKKEEDRIKERRSNNDWVVGKIVQ